MGRQWQMKFNAAEMGLIRVLVRPRFLLLAALKSIYGCQIKTKCHWVILALLFNTWYRVFLGSYTNNVHRIGPIKGTISGGLKQWPENFKISLIFFWPFENIGCLQLRNCLLDQSGSVFILSILQKIYRNVQLIQSSTKMKLFLQ